MTVNIHCELSLRLHISSYGLLTRTTYSHLHGHTMQIIHRAENYTSDDPELNPPFIEGQANPMRRDTVHVPGGGSVTLRVVADNPGVWFIHCMCRIPPKHHPPLFSPPMY